LKTNTAANPTFHAVRVQVDYIHVIEMTKDNFCAVVGLPAMFADFKEIHGRTQATLYYDTTFCMGDFYVSSLFRYKTEFRSLYNNYSELNQTIILP